MAAPTQAEGEIIDAETLRPEVLGDNQDLQAV
jgi:hypothetical protein